MSRRRGSISKGGSAISPRKVWWDCGQGKDTGKSRFPTPMHGHGTKDGARQCNERHRAMSRDD